MATSEILLLEKVEGLGAEGAQVSVRAGYARNFLFPKKKAIPVTRANRRQIEALAKRREMRENAELASAKELRERILALSIVFSVKTGVKGKMFGAVTQADLLERLREAGLEIGRKKLHLEPVKELGPHRAELQLHPAVVFELPFEIVSENPLDRGE
ncbi:MAG: 50S ribosomal protein L9 [Puniceicoccales bacterium]|jgi:large subunit ribosomal protein L9|nr:50S ribosomal protein L9 [Puniceicoccales bacterium]